MKNDLISGGVAGNAVRDFRRPVQAGRPVAEQCETEALRQRLGGARRLPFKWMDLAPPGEKAAGPSQDIALIEFCLERPVPARHEPSFLLRPERDKGLEVRRQRVL